MTANVTMVSFDRGHVQEMSGTACSEMWGLWFSSDLLSDRVSPCNLETTQHITRTHAMSIHTGVCLETEGEIRGGQCGPLSDKEEVFSQFMFPSLLLVYQRWDCVQGKNMRVHFWRMNYIFYQFTPNEGVVVC